MMAVISGLLSVFICLVRVCRLLLRHKVKHSDVPDCVIHMLNEIGLQCEELVWHELWCFKTVDGLVQGFDITGERVFVAWADMGEIFRLYYRREGKEHYQVTVAPYIWEPLLAEAALVKSIERDFEVNTKREEGIISKTLSVHRNTTNDGQRVELRQSCMRWQHNSDVVQNNTEVRRYIYQPRLKKFVLNIKKYWRGDLRTLPRTETELHYDYNESVYKRKTIKVNVFGGADELMYFGDYNTKPTVTKIQRYNEVSKGLRRRRQQNVLNLGDSVVYQMPELRA